MMQSLKPIIQARLILDNENKPEIDGWRSYKIEVSVTGFPPDTFAVTYFLHESYYDPVRESHDKSSNFSIELTSYGDFEIKARIRAKSSSILISRHLSDALQETHGSSDRYALTEVLQKIAENPRQSQRGEKTWT